MKLGFDAKRLFNNFTGIGNFSRTLLGALTENMPQWEYFLYTPKVDENDVTKPFLHKENCHVKTPTGIVRGSLWRSAAISSCAKKDQIDLYHGLSNELPMGLPCPSVVTIHDVAFRTFTDMYSVVDRSIYDAKWKHACKTAKRIVAISESTKKDIVNFYNIDPEKIDVIYQPAAPRFYEEVAPRPESLFIKKPFLLYAGTINSRKNLLGIVKALQLLPIELQIPLVVVGQGSGYKRQVQQFVKEYQMEKLVIFPEKRVSDEELHQFYLNAEAFVYPSFYEGFGLPVVEALLSSCPVLTSNVSSLPEAGGEKSLKADPTSIEDISQKLDLILSNTTLREDMKKAGRDYALRMFSLEKCAKAHIDLYERVINS